MYGIHQVYNACLSIEALKVLEIEDEFIKAGLSEMYFEGRFEKLSDKPLVFIDGGHNPQGAKTVVDTVKKYSFKNPTFIVSVYKEKDACGFIENLLGNGEILLTSFDDEMCHNPIELSEKYNLKAVGLASVIEEIKSSEEDKTYIFCGSIYQISKIKSFFDKT